MQHLRIVFMLFVLLIPLSACSQSPAEKAFKELRQRSIDYTEESFIEYVKNGDKAMVDLFLTAGMSPNLRRSGSGKEPILNIAAVYNHAEIVSLLLAKGADVNAKDNEGWTALMIAKKRTLHDIVDILEKAGATIPKELIEGLLTVADSQWQKGDYQNALQNYQKILLLEPNNSKAKEFLKKYSAVELTIDEIEYRFKKSQGLNEFEQKKRSEEQKEFLSRKETYFSTLDNGLEFAISKYDFKKKRYIVTVGLMQGGATGPIKGYSSVVSNDVFLIVNEDGRHLVFPLNIDEEKAASLKSHDDDKEKQKVLVIYKLKKVERFTDAIGITPSRANPRGGAILVDRFRRYIKPLYIALLTGNEKYVLYEAKESEIKSESTTKIKPIEKRRKRK